MNRLAPDGFGRLTVRTGGCDRVPMQTGGASTAARTADDLETLGQSAREQRGREELVRAEAASRLALPLWGVCRAWCEQTAECDPLRSDAQDAEQLVAAIRITLGLLRLLRNLCAAGPAVQVRHSMLTLCTTGPPTRTDTSPVANPYSHLAAEACRRHWRPRGCWWWSLG
jgi:hypothetical protein